MKQAGFSSRSPLELINVFSESGLGVVSDNRQGGP